MSWLIAGALIWAGGWWANTLLARGPKTGFTRLAVPLIFGLTIIAVWECVVRGLDISIALLPAPTWNGSSKRQG